MKKLLLLISITLLFALTAFGQIENPRLEEDPFAEPGTLLDIPENATVYIVVKSARSAKTTKMLTRFIEDKTNWEVVENPKEANVAIQTGQQRRAGLWAKEYGMYVYVRKNGKTPLVWQNVRTNKLFTSAPKKLIGAFIQDWKTALKKKDED